MKKINKLVFLLLIFCVSCLCACFSPWMSGEGFITINFGSPARMIGFVDADGDEYKNFNHEITVRNSEAMSSGDSQ